MVLAAVVLAAVVLAVFGSIIAHPARGQDGDANADGPPSDLPPQVPTTAAAEQVTVNDVGLFDLHLRQVALSDALRVLSQEARRNISVAQSVDSAVTTGLIPGVL